MGPDANLNLFKVKMSGLGALDSKLKTISGRTTTFVSPQRDSASIDLPYQNINVAIPTPNVSMPKLLEMTLRIDSGYLAYEYLRSLQLIDENGKYIRDENKKILSMTVTAYDTSSRSASLAPIYQWKFNNLYLLTLSRFSFSYESANQITCNMGLVWGTYTEGPCSENSI